MGDHPAKTASAVDYNYAETTAEEGSVAGAARPGARKQRCFSDAVASPTTAAEVAEWVAFMQGEGVGAVVSLLSPEEAATYEPPGVEAAMRAAFGADGYSRFNAKDAGEGPPAAWQRAACRAPPAPQLHKHTPPPLPDPNPKAPPRRPPSWTPSTRCWRPKRRWSFTAGAAAAAPASSRRPGWRARGGCPRRTRRRPSCSTPRQRACRAASTCARSRPSWQRRQQTTRREDPPPAAAALDLWVIVLCLVAILATAGCAL